MNQGVGIFIPIEYSYSKHNLLLRKLLFFAGGNLVNTLRFWSFQRSLNKLPSFSTVSQIAFHNPPDNLQECRAPSVCSAINCAILQCVQVARHLVKLPCSVWQDGLAARRLAARLGVEGGKSWAAELRVDEKSDRVSLSEGQSRGWEEGEQTGDLLVIWRITSAATPQLCFKVDSI